MEKEKEKKKRMTSHQTLFPRIILPGGRNTKPLSREALRMQHIVRVGEWERRGGLAKLQVKLQMLLPAKP